MPPAVMLFGSRLLLPLLTGALLSTGYVHGALQVSGYDPDLHERLNDSANFIGNGFDWSGVGQTSDGRWVTMISDQYFVTAAHYHPELGAPTLRFYHDNDLGGTFEEHTVDFGWSVQLMTDQGLSDIWIGRLLTTVSSEVTSYNIFDPLGDPNTLEGDSIFVVGNSGGNAYENFRVGTNMVDLENGFFGVQERSVSIVNGWSATHIYDEAVTGDTLFQSGDSGAPTFVVNGGVLELIGVHSVTGTAPPVGLDGDFSMDSLVSGYRQEILALITPVPEPGGAVLLLVAGLFFWRQGRRR